MSEDESDGIVYSPVKLILLVDKCPKEELDDYRVTAAYLLIENPRS
jgi:hypothetical protein